MPIKFDNINLEHIILGDKELSDVIIDGTQVYKKRKITMTCANYKIWGDSDPEPSKLTADYRYHIINDPVDGNTKTYQDNYSDFTWGAIKHRSPVYTDPYYYRMGTATKIIEIRNDPYLKLDLSHLGERLELGLYINNQYIQRYNTSNGAFFTVSKITNDISIIFGTTEEGSLASSYLYLPSGYTITQSSS